MDVSLSKLQEMLKGREAWRAAVHGVTKSWIGLSSWTHEIKEKNKHTGDFPGGLAVKGSPADAGDTNSIPCPGGSHVPWNN